MPLDFISNQIRTTQIIASGSSLNSAIAIYGSSSATDYVGGTTFPGPGPGTDTFLFVSGSKATIGIHNSRGAAVFGGDVLVSGTFGVFGDASLGSATPSPTKIRFLGRSDSNILPDINKNFNLGTNALQWLQVHSSTGSFEFLNVSSRGVFPAALSGSLQQTSAGLPYLVAGTNITITTASNGQVTITSTGGAGTPAGSDQQVQFNNAGSFGASANFNFNSTSNRMSLTGSLGMLGDIVPDSDTTHNLGTTDKRWANVYTGDLHLRNDRGDWTIVEEEDFLCVINNKSRKRYKMMLQPLD